MDIKKIREYRLKSGGFAIIEYLKNIEPEKLIFDLYLPIKNEETKTLVHYYEQHLLLAKLDKNKFIKKRYKMIKDIVHWIKKNNKYKLFAEFCMYIERNMERKHHEILCAYMTALMDTWVNIAPYGYWWYGLDRNQQPLIIKELYGPYDVKGYEIYEEMQKKPHKKAELMLKVMELDEKTSWTRFNERNISNVVFSMLDLIDEENQDFIFPYDKWFDHHHVLYDMPREYKSNEEYLNMLDKRSFILNSEGVTVRCFNAGIFGEINFKEEFLENGMIVLFKVKHSSEEGCTTGFMDLRNKYIFSAWKHTNEAEGINYNRRFLNFVLEVYSHLTCNFEKNINRLVALKQLDNLNEPFNLKIGQPGIYCESNNTEHKESSKGREVIHKAFHKVNPFIRKGNASELAKANARMYGVVLQQGYTFVRDHYRGLLKDQITKQSEG